MPLPLAGCLTTEVQLPDGRLAAYNALPWSQNEVIWLYNDRNGPKKAFGWAGNVYVCVAHCDGGEAPLRYWAWRTPDNRPAPTRGRNYGQPYPVLPPPLARDP